MNKKKYFEIYLMVYMPFRHLGRIVCPAALPTVLCRLLLPLQL